MASCMLSLLVYLLLLVQVLSTHLQGISEQGENRDREEVISS
jgi:hypothetical protein